MKKSKDSNNVSESEIGILDPLGINNNPLTGKPYTETYRNLAKVWSKFPAYVDAKNTIKEIIDNNVILVISGTGSGKTVLFPKFVLHALDYKGKVATTLPKQIITKSSATFAAETLDVNVGEEVGFKYRNSGRDTLSNKTKLLYCTDGTLVAMLLSDPELRELDAVLVDEAHERKVNIDFLLYLLKNVVKIRPEFKLVIMSATINEAIFKNYFKDTKYINVEIGTKTNYPIESVFLSNDLEIGKGEYIKEGLNLIREIINTSKSSDKGGILLFVTSVNETNEVCDILNEKGDFKESNICISVYSGMNDDEQKKATDKEYFRQFVGSDGRKVIVSTNVAESSLTIDGISHVIDSGLELRSRFDPINRVDILEKGYITSAQAKQRMGRTGRTGPGKCYHLYTEDTFSNKMEKFPLPSIKIESISYEMMRLLAIKGIDNVGTLRATFRKFIEPPDDKYINAELMYLHKLGMITSDDNTGALSEIGNIVSSLQIEPHLALMMITSFRLNCFREVLGVISVIDAIKGSMEQLFILPTDIIDDQKSDANKTKWLTKKFDVAKEHFSNQYGDHIAILKIFGEYEKTRDDSEKLRKWAYKYFIKRDVLNKAYDTYAKMKQMYRGKIHSHSFTKPDQTILDEELKYKIMASLLAGTTTRDTTFNKLKISNGKIITVGGDLKNIQLDKINFIENPTENKSTMFYHKLHQFNTGPVKAKIVSKISQKSLDILDEVLKLPLLIEKNIENVTENN